MNNFLWRFIHLFYHATIQFFSIVAASISSPISFFLSAILRFLKRQPPQPIQKPAKPPISSHAIDWTIRRIKPAKDPSRNPFKMPAPLLRFSKSYQNAQTDFSQLRSSEQNPQVMRQELRQVRAMAKVIYAQGPRLASFKALERTENAAKFFFAQAYHLVSSGAMKAYPLEGLNKCIAFFALPKSKLVFVAISEDKLPTKDVEVRQALLRMMTLLNTHTAPYRFELVARPTKEQYLLLRTLNMRHDGVATREIVEPRFRCSEVALMIAACKIGRFKPLTLDDIGVIPFGSGLWHAQMGDEPIQGFSASFRNMKYKKKKPLKIPIGIDSHAYLDVWEACPEHCAKFYHQMRAISASGTSATTFNEPRAESFIYDSNRRADRLSL